jgi:uncharacterized membrane protein
MVAMEPLLRVVDLSKTFGTLPIIQLRTKAARESSLQGRIADAITSFSGRMIFAYMHILWFGIWILLNTGWFGVRVFDPFPTDS